MAADDFVLQREAEEMMSRRYGDHSWRLMGSEIGNPGREQVYPCSGNSRFKDSFAQAAFLVLSAAATRTGVVAARLGNCPSSRSFCRRGLPFEGLTPPQGGELRNERLAVGEEAFIACTQVVQSRFAIRRLEDTVLRTPTMAHVQDLACLAIAG